VKARRRWRGDGGGRPHTHGRAWALSWQVATLVARAISSGVANDWPAKASRRNSRHQPSWRFSQQAPLGMKACWMRGWSASHARVEALVWLERLAQITVVASGGVV